MSDLDKIARWLEDRDRRLEQYLDLLAGQAVSVTATEEAVWTPSPHADTHATTGVDWVSPASIGADTAADRDTAIEAARSVFEDEGTPLTKRTNVNFTGAGVTATDAGGKTVVDIPGGAGADESVIVALSSGRPSPWRPREREGHVIEDEGTPLVQRGTINFTGAGITVTDTGGKTTVDVPTPAAGADEGLMWALSGVY